MKAQPEIEKKITEIEAKAEVVEKTDPHAWYFYLGQIEAFQWVLSDSRAASLII